MKKYPPLPQAFADIGIETRFLKALVKMHFEQPSDIQQKLIPVALDGQDILGQARTGTGKTAAFGLPILQQLNPGDRLQALCLVPTRELAVQAVGELRRMAEFTDLHIVAVYGGQKVRTQLHELGRKPHFVVGTPGRVMDFIQRRVLSMDSIRFVVLDEVDRMLDIGFRDDIRSILGRITTSHQTIFVSATLHEEIKRLAKRYMRDPVEINVSQDRITVDEVNQSYVTTEPQDKFHLLRLVLKQEDPPVCIIFCNTKHAARKLAKKLFDAGYNAKEIHGDLVQRQRDQVMTKFRKHQIQLLVATDLAARGIDVSSISHIINYDIPQDPEIYVHRIGRTARMGAEGVAITFVTRDEGKELTAVEKLINREVPAREVAGFAPSNPVEETTGTAQRDHDVSQAPQPAPSIAAASDSTTFKAPPKTLGGRFKPSRRRKL